MAARGNGVVNVWEVGGRLLQKLQLGFVRGWLDSDHLIAQDADNPAEDVMVDLRRSPDGLVGALTPMPSVRLVGVFPGGLD